MAAKDRKNADAVLRGSLVTRPDKQGGTGQAEGGQVTVRLFNAAGEMLWSTTQKSPDAKSHDFAAEVTARIVKDLLDQVQKLEQQRAKPK